MQRKVEELVNKAYYLVEQQQYEMKGGERNVA